MQPVKYELYPSGQLSIARSDAHQYVANVSLPVTAAMRQEIENYLTSFNRRTSIETNETKSSFFFFFRIRRSENRLSRSFDVESNAFLSCGS